MQDNQASNNWIRCHWEVLITVIIVLYFSLRLIYFATHIHPQIPSDETTHIGRSQAYSKVLLIPENTPETYEFGHLTHRPFLYYWLMGRAINLNFFSMDILTFSRLINCIMGIIAAVYVYKWIRLVSENKLVRVVTVIIFTNILMLTGLFASVSYDNLTNLLSVMLTYYLALFFNKRDTNTLILFFICLLAGCITKKTFLPLALFFITYLLIVERKSLLHLPSCLIGSLKPLKPLRFALCSVAVILFALNGILYCGNLIRYGRVLPSSGVIIGADNAMQYRINIRNYLFNQYKQGKYSYEYAIQQTAQIKNPSDRAAAVQLLQITRDAKEKNEKPMGPIRYITEWSRGMLERTVGYTGHQILLKSPKELCPYYIVFLVAGVMLIRKLFWSRENRRTLRSNFFNCPVPKPFIVPRQSVCGSFGNHAGDKMIFPEG